MGRTDTIISTLINLSEKSPCNAKLGAIITKGSSRPESFGFNHHRTRIHGNNSTCMHAEMHAAIAIYKRIKMKKKFSDTKMRRIMNKYTVWVARISKQNRLASSMPCMKCRNSLLYMGFSRVCFINNDGNFELKNLNDNGFSHMSVAQLSFYGNN